MAEQPKYQITESVFLRLLGLVYLAAFGSFWPQIAGLLGSHGIVAVGRILPLIRAESGLRAYLYMPSLFWFGISDSALIGVCVLGCLGSVLLISGFYPRIAAGICWALYLSIISVGQPFTGFQWDALLLESGFLAIFAGTPWLVWAYRALLFRLMFESGAVKLLSHDPNWRNLHALRFHFLTQPLPNPLAYYVFRAPAWLLDSMTFCTLGIELIAPFLLFGPRRVRQTSVGLLILLQVLILLTGNYAFFNLLALALCLWGLDDLTFAPLSRLLRKPTASLHPAFNAVPILLMAIGALQVLGMFAPGLNGPLSKPLNVVGAWEIVNSYGLFAVMTTTRPEIVLEGSDDQVSWQEYSFRYKPGDLHRGLPMVAPHQPRLDWQMWFAALGDYAESTWVAGLVERLLQGDPAVLGLMDPPPFRKPPRYARALLYNYEFTAPEERRRTGAIWKRRLLRVWFGPVSLDPTKL